MTQIFQYYLILSKYNKAVEILSNFVIHHYQLWSIKRLESNVCNFSIHFQQVHVLFYLFYFIVFFVCFSLSSKSVFFTKLAKSVFLTEFVCLSLGVKLTDVNLLNLQVVIYLS